MMRKTEPQTRELELGDRLLTRIHAGPPSANGPPTLLPATTYTDPERHRAEVASVAAHPVAVVAASEIATPGAFITTTLADRNIIITRDRDGDVHAMLNACAHRGATVETRHSGTARILSCGFHGWPYELDGTLRAVADAPLFASEPCKKALRSLTCEERHGIIWVIPDAEHDKHVADWLGPDIDQLLTDLGAGAMVHHASTDYDLECNWKLLTDGFLEIYHLQYLHRNSIAPYFPANTNLTERHGNHFIGWLPKNRLVRDLTEQPRDTWQVYNGLTGAIVLTPGTVIQWQAGHIELFSLRPHPTDPTRTMARLTMLVPADRVDNSELWDRNWERVCETIPNEDFAAAVDVQRNINAGAVEQLQIGANEHALIEHLDAVLSTAALVERDQVRSAR